MTEGNKVISNITESMKTSLPDDFREEKEFAWYINEVLENPELLRNAHQRVADMIEYYGKTYDEEEDFIYYDMFYKDPLHDGRHKLVGKNFHKNLADYVNAIQGGARRLGPHERIKLLLGPVGSGKSQSDRLVRRYYEDYTSRDAGRMYTFKFINLCDVIEDQDPKDDSFISEMRQDPVVLLPKEDRAKEVMKPANENYDSEYNLRNRQSLSHKSDFILDKLLEYYDDDLEEVLDNHVRVIRLVANEDKRKCIETFEPKDKKNQDETELTGEVNYSKIAVYGESDPRSFDYSGAFCNANRGIFSGEELLKLQEEFLYDFLHATQERTIKPKNHPRIDIDQVIVGRTNMPEYRDKRNNEKMEAFNDRVVRIDLPYILEYTKEAQIYEMLIAENADIGDCHIEPHTLEMAGLFAILTRLSDPNHEGVDILEKAKIYDGKKVSHIDEKELRDDAAESLEMAEGLTGISPRFVVDELSRLAMDRINKDENSIDAHSLLEYIQEELKSYGEVDDENVEDYNLYVEKVKQEYNERVIEDVISAIAVDNEEMHNQAEKYIDNAVAYVDDEKVENEVMGLMEDPDEEFMRSIETQIGEGGIEEEHKDSFRREISNWASRQMREGELDPLKNPKLKEGVKQKIWDETSDNINVSSMIRDIKDEDGGEINQGIENLKRKGYSTSGAIDAFEYAAAKIAKDESN